MKYDVKGWLLQASKEDLIAAATHHSVSTGITNPYQLRRMLLDKFEWNHSHDDQRECARFLSISIGKTSYQSEKLTLGWVITRELEHGVMIGLTERFKWQGLDAMVTEAKEKAGREQNARQSLEHRREQRQEERLGESLVDEPAPTEKVIGAQSGPRMVQVESHVCGGGLSINIHRDDGTSYQIKGEDLDAWKDGRFVLATVNSRQGDGELSPFTPVEPNPESLDDLSLEDLLGYYATLDLLAKTSVTRSDHLESNHDYDGAREQHHRAVSTVNARHELLKHIERRFEKQGWLISRIKDR